MLGALELAVTLKDKCVSEFFGPDGEYVRAQFGTHTHSTTCVLSGLAALAELSSDGELLRRVRAFYSRGLNEIRDELGWCIENSGGTAPPDGGCRAFRAAPHSHQPPCGCAWGSSTRAPPPQHAGQADCSGSILRGMHSRGGQ